MNSQAAKKFQLIPSVTVYTPQDYAGKIVTASKLSSRIHIDVSDGLFTPQKTPNLAQLYWGDSDRADLHLMMRRVSDQQEQLISLSPSLVIIHAEADESPSRLLRFMKELQKLSIKAGVALLQQTAVSSAADLIKQADHALIFTGKLGYYGGQLDLPSLAKIAQAKELKSGIEVSVDGGVNDENIARVVAAGADVVITGGFTMNAARPKSAYTRLLKAAGVRP